MTVSDSLTPAQLSQLAACAERLGVTPEEALQRAVARLHMALFDQHADPSAVDAGQSVAEPTGPDASVRELPGLSA